MCQLQIDWRSVWPQLEEPFEAVQVPGAAFAQGPGVCCAGIQPGRAAVGAVSQPHHLLPHCLHMNTWSFNLCLVASKTLLCLVFQTVIFYL